MQSKCVVSGKTFTVSEHEVALRKKFGFDDVPNMLPKYRFQYLGAFWPQWNFHKRKCDKTGQSIISVFRPDCKYPVWQRDEWVKHADPPSQDFDFSRPFFEQASGLFPKCPLPHNFQSHNQNCEYADDWYQSKNCYLCQGGQNNEDCKYCFYSDGIKNVHNGIFSFNSDFCFDLINSSNCNKGLFLLNCKNVSDSAFLYDCRDCRDCLFSCNLRNKKYCFDNRQLTKEEYEQKKKGWDFSSHRNYEKAIASFSKMMKEKAWHRPLQIDLCENSTGNFIHHCKDCENCYMLSYSEGSVNVAFSGPHTKTNLDSLGTVGAELAFMCSLPVYCYDAKFCFSVNHCKFVEYSAYLQNCDYCFGCCGLFKKKYCIFNKQYSEDEYFKMRNKIIEYMKKTGEWGKFFPVSIAPNPYNESFSGFQFPVEANDERFARAASTHDISIKTAEIKEIPESIKEITEEKEEWLIKQVFWDEKYQRPFQVQKDDIKFARTMNAPLPKEYFINRIQRNFSWMPFNGELREAICAKSGGAIKTNWPSEYDGRILSEAEYLKIIK